jgi:hypothetical protein
MKSSAPEVPTRNRTTRSTGESPRTNLAAPPKGSTRIGLEAGPPNPYATAKVQPRSITVPRRGSKTARVLALLKRPQGASLKDLLKATGWQPHSVRGFLSGTVAGKMGLKILSSKTESGERRYSVKP